MLRTPLSTSVRLSRPPGFRALAVLTGLGLGLLPLKFGNPVIFEEKIETPRTLLQWIIQPWPLVLAWVCLGALVLAGAVVAVRAPLHAMDRRSLAPGARPALPRWVLVLPLAWLVWNLFAAAGTVDAVLSRIAVLQFSACVLCFYVGLFGVSRLAGLGPVWLGWGAGFALVLAAGFEQHFGGLEEARRWFFAYEMPRLVIPPSTEFLQKIQSRRIYSTLFYPNTLAGVILLALPVLLGAVARTAALTRAARGALLALIAGGALACLIWSGSKAGWLIFLGAGTVAFLHLPLQRWFKLAVAVTLLVAGLVGFVVKFRDYLTGGATSAVARFDYWGAAAATLGQHPLLGSGPGTFGVVYRRIKRPESEMARLAHNDYLQQGSDAGLPGLLLFSALVWGSLICLRRRSVGDRIMFPVWLGVAAAAVQGFVEFGLFIPALAWPQFLLLGWLWGRATAPP